MGNLLRLLTGDKAEDSQQIFLNFESKFKKLYFLRYFSPTLRNKSLSCRP